MCTETGLGCFSRTRSSLVLHALLDAVLVSVLHLEACTSNNQIGKIVVFVRPLSPTCCEELEWRRDYGATTYDVRKVDSAVSQTQIQAIQTLEVCVWREREQESKQECERARERVSERERERE